jgi:phenylacetate-CoA ligase
VSAPVTSLDRSDLEARQLDALRRMLDELLPRNRFVTERLARAGVTAPVESLDEFFERVPFTKKQELVEDQLAHPPYGTNLTYAPERYTRFHQTSGTTGAPLRWLDTPESWDWCVENWAEVFRAAGVGAGDRVFFAFSFGPFLGFWTAFDAAGRLGCLCIPGGGMSSAARIHTLLDNQATVVCCTPTYAIRLAEVAQELGLDLRQSAVHTLIAAGEPGASIPATRARIERLWNGARVRDHHGMTEIGPVSIECPVRPGVLHILEGSFIPEVIDPHSGARPPRGTEGELVLTNLGRAGSPILRYRTGDLVRSAPEPVCACGRADLALEGGILGRTDDMVVIRGVNLYPGAVEDVVRRFEAVAEYRVEVSSSGALAEAHLRLEPVNGCPDPDALAQELQAALRSAFNLRLPVTPVAAGTLPRFELKAKRWVRVPSAETEARHG